MHDINFEVDFTIIALLVLQVISKATLTVITM